MNPNVHAGRLERRVRLVGRETLLGLSGFCSLLTVLFVGQQKRRCPTYPAIKPMNYRIISYFAWTSKVISLRLFIVLVANELTAPQNSFLPFASLYPK